MPFDRQKFELARIRDFLLCISLVLPHHNFSQEREKEREREGTSQHQTSKSEIFLLTVKYTLNTIDNSLDGQ